MPPARSATEPAPNATPLSTVARESGPRAIDLTALALDPVPIAMEC